jgi:tetratricopeptide (TPR) repeat protein
LLESLPAGGASGLRAVFVTGPAGSGKTALVRWLDRAAAARDLGVGIGVAGHIEGEWPYAPVLEALSDLCRRHPELLGELSPRLRTEMDDALSGRPVAWDGQGAHQRLYVAAAELVQRAADVQGLVLVVDDAHRADEASLSLLSHIARALVDRPALLVVGARSTSQGRLRELQETMQSRGRAVQVDVGPLTHEAAVAMARSLAPSAADDVLDQIFQRSGGLPFGVAELARRWTADPTADAFTAWIPPGLSAEETAVLSRVSVLGTTFDTDEMAALTCLSDDEVYAVIDSGLEHRVLVRERPYYGFRHRLIRESFVDAMTESDRMAAHRAAAEALQRLGRSPARVGHHLVEAGLVEQAVDPLFTAAETEAAHGAYRAALQSLELIESAVSGADRQRLAAMRADLLYARGDLGAVDAYREALAVAAPEQRARLLTRLAKAAVSSGDLETAAQALAEVGLDGSPNDAELLLVRGNLAFQQQDYEAADAAASQARERIGVAGERWQLFDLVALQGLLAHLRGEWFQRLRVELRSTAERPDVAAGIFDSHLCVAEFLLYGPTPYDEVLVLADQLRSSAAESGVLRAVAFATALRGEAALLKGDLDLAEGELLDSVELHHDLESAAGEAHSLQRLAEVHLARGDRATAESMLNRALPLARWSPIAPHLLQRVYGTLILAAPDPETAFSVVERAEATLSPEDDCLFCTIMLDLPAAQASAAVGDFDRAHAYIASAEVSAERWQGTAWQASVTETRGHLAFAEGRADDGRRLMREAALLFESSGQPLDAARCRTSAGGSPVAITPG